MHVGDYWEYVVPDPDQAVRHSSRIVGETLLVNGLGYYKFESKTIDPPLPEVYVSYRRIDDSLNVMRYIEGGSCPTMEYLEYKLSGFDRSVWSVCWNDNYPLYTLRTLYLTDSTDDQYLGVIHRKSFGSATIDSSSGDTIYFPIGAPIIVLSEHLGISEIQIESQVPSFLVGAIINGVVYGTPTSVGPFDHLEDLDLASSISLHPNPVNPWSTLSLTLRHASPLDVRVFNLIGQEVGSIASGMFSPGTHTLPLNTDNLPSGYYFLRITIAETNIFKKFLVIR